MSAHNLSRLHHVLLECHFAAAATTTTTITAAAAFYAPTQPSTLALTNSLGVPLRIIVRIVAPH